MSEKHEGEATQGGDQVPAWQVGYDPAHPFGKGPTSCQLRAMETAEREREERRRVGIIEPRPNESPSDRRKREERTGRNQHDIAIRTLVRLAKERRNKLRKAYPSGMTERGMPLPKAPSVSPAAPKGTPQRRWIKEQERACKVYLAATKRFSETVDARKKRARKGLQMRGRPRKILLESDR